MAITPEEILPAGDDEAVVINPFTGIAAKARKGTVAATLNNIALLDKLLLQNSDFSQIDQISQAVTRLIPSLKVVGIFDLFDLEEWMNDPKRLGRIYVVALYLKEYRAEMSREIVLKLKTIKETTDSTPLKLLLEEILLLK